jgi:hypothetical protein
MAWTRKNFKTKKALRIAVQQGEQVEAYQPGPFGPNLADGKTVIEGPHECHRWYAAVWVKDGIIVAEKGVK